MTEPSEMISISRFTTAQVAPKDRRDLWVQNMGALFNLNAPSGGILDHGIEGRIDVALLGDVLIGRAFSASQLFHRNARRISQDGLDHFLIQFFLHGGGSPEDKETIQPGDMMVIDLGQPHAMINSEFENLSLIVPRDLSPRLSVMLEPLHGRRLPAHHPLVVFLGGSMTSFWDAMERMTIDQATWATQGYLDMLHHWLTHDRKTFDDLTPAASQALSDEIRRYIDLNLDENHTPEGLAQKFNVSRTKLYQLFAKERGVTNYLWERRTNRALRMLSLAAFDHLSISYIAYDCGFTSEAHFSRTIRERSTLSPREVRHEAQRERKERLQRTAIGPDEEFRLGDWLHIIAPAGRTLR